VPMTLGQEFTAYAVTTAEDVARLRETVRLFLEVNMGGTAIGTGINADPRYPELVIDELRHVTGLDVTLSENLVEATPDTGAFVMFSGVLKRTAVKLSKMCNDLRLLSSGPRCGLAEINLPARQPGSSIMPGKVNPVIPEVVNQVAYQIIGNDLTTLTSRCIVGITANAQRCRDMVEHSIGIVTALVPTLGYDKASEVAAEALQTGRPVRDIVLDRAYLSAEALDVLLSPEAMTRPRPMAPSR